MQDTWNRIIAWCEKYAPEIIEGFNPGATDEELRAAEAHFGVTFPFEMHQLYTLNNGQKGWDAAGLFPGNWLSLEGMKCEWETWEELRKGGTFADNVGNPSKGVRADWWNPGWIPITADGGGNNICVDLNPAENGVSGQLIHMWHDDSVRDLVAMSIGTWLEQLVDDLESGEAVFSPEEYGAVISRDDVGDGEEWRGIDRDSVS